MSDRRPFDQILELEEALLQGKAIGAHGYQRDGIQGRPDERSITSPGRIITLSPDDNSDTIDAGSNDPLINEWGVYVAPTPASLEALAGGDVWGVTMTIEVSHDSARFVYYRSIYASSPVAVPIAGIALAVHGQRIRVGLIRTDPGAIGALTLACAVVPRLPGPCSIPFSGSATAATPFRVPVMSMSRTLSIMSSLDPGDRLNFLGPDRTTSVGSFGLTDAILLKPIPIPPEACVVSLNTFSVTGKDVMVTFESWF